MSLTKDRFFIDTNIIVYIFDRNNKEKYETALSIIKLALESGNGMIGFQVIQEFCNVALRKFKKPLSAEDCKKFVNRFLYPICNVFPGVELYNNALDINAKTGYNFYDSLILASAMQGDCRVLYSEDMRNGREVLGVKIINPFAESYN